MKKPPKARVCNGCGKPKGTIPIAMHGYWHLKCWQKRRALLSKSGDGSTGRRLKNAADAEALLAKRYETVR